MSPTLAGLPSPHRSVAECKLGSNPKNSKYRTKDSIGIALPDQCQAKLQAALMRLTLTMLAPKCTFWQLLTSNFDASLNGT